MRMNKLVVLAQILDRNQQHEKADCLDKIIDILCFDGQYKTSLENLNTNFMEKSSAPYRWEDNEDTVKSILKTGYDPRDALFLYIEAYPGNFYADLSEESRNEMDAFGEEIDFSLDYSDLDGPKWDEYVDKLAELWIKENPRTILLWLASSPLHAMEFAGPSEYQRNLLRYTSPEGQDDEVFLDDYSYGYAIKVVPPEGHEGIPGEWFELVSPEEWEKHKDDFNHWYD